MRNLTWIIGGIVAALVFIPKLMVGQKAVFILRSLRTGGSILNPNFGVEFIVQNPTNQRIIIKSVTGAVSVNGQFLADVSAFGDQIIERNKESKLVVNARSSALSIFKTVRAILAQPIGTNKLTFDGQANVDGLIIPIQQTKEI